MQGTLVDAAVAAIATLSRRYEVDPDRIGAAVGVDPRIFVSPSTAVSTREFNGLLEEAARSCRRRFFALELAGLLANQFPDLLFAAAAPTDSVKLAVSALETLLEQLTEGRLLLLTVRVDDDIALCLEARRLTIEGEPFHDSLVQVTELAMALLCFQLRRILGNAWRPRYVQFRHARPAERASLVGLFGENLYFDQDVYAVTLSSHDFTSRTTSSNPVRKGDSDDSVGSVPGTPLPILVHRVILTLINKGRCSLGSVAAQLSCRPRTLQHRLRNHQTSYQHLVDQARYELAKQYLRHSDLNIVSIAERLGFHDLPALSNFFRKRSGLAPRIYRVRYQSKV